MSRKTLSPYLDVLLEAVLTVTAGMCVLSFVSFLLCLALCFTRPENAGEGMLIFLFVSVLGLLFFRSVKRIASCGLSA